MGSDVIAGVLISLAAFAIALTLVHRLASEELGARAADATVLLLAFAPLSFFFSAVYTESLLLALRGGTFYLASRGRFRLACVVAAGAALTHIQGILLVAPLAWMYWESRGRTSEPAPAVVAGPARSLLAPVWRSAGSSSTCTRRDGAGSRRSPARTSPTAGRTLVGPADRVVRLASGTSCSASSRRCRVANSRERTARSPFQNLSYLVWLTVTILALVSARRRLPREYVLFAGLAILICTSSAVAMDPLEGFDRYMLPIFPLWIGLAAWLERHRLTGAVVTISTVLLVMCTIDFTRWLAVF